jgi:MoaA/NifB/PqqE/SkfB family radical SAM enzyme
MSSSNFLQKQGLTSANLEVTQKCDSRCVSCNIWRMPESSLTDDTTSRREELSFDDHTQILDELSTLGCKTVQLHGGEPLLNPRLADLVAHCSSLGIFTGIATNGLSMTPDKAKDLVDAGLGSIKFSLDGPKELHNRLRGRKDAYEKQIHALVRVIIADKDQRVYKCVRSNVSSVNLQRIDEVIDIAKTLSIADIQFAFYSVLDKASVNEANEIFHEAVASLRSVIPKELLPNNIELIQKKRTQMRNKAAAYGITLGNTRFFSLPADQIPNGIKRERTRCTLFDDCLTIDAFGDTLPCEYLRFSLGNTKSRELGQILAGERFSVFKNIYSNNYRHLRICDYCCYSL